VLGSDVDAALYEPHHTEIAPAIRSRCTSRETSINKPVLTS
jgi:hypothetical protein